MSSSRVRGDGVASSAGAGRDSSVSALGIFKLYDANLPARVSIGCKVSMNISRHRADSVRGWFGGLDLRRRGEQAGAGPQHAPVGPNVFAKQNFTVARFRIEPTRDQREMFGELWRHMLHSKLLANLGRAHERALFCWRRRGT